MSTVKANQTAEKQAGRAALGRILTLVGISLGFALAYGWNDLHQSGPSPTAETPSKGLLFSFYAWVYEHPALALVTALLILIIYNIVGRGFGLSRLFLDEKAGARFTSSFGAVLLIGSVMASTFLIENVMADSTNKSSNYATTANMLKWVLGDLRPSSHFQIGNVDNPDDSGWRLLTFTLVASFPFWILVWVAGVPFRFLEGNRYASREFGAIAQRFLSWTAGVLAGIATIWLLVYLSIRLTGNVAPRRGTPGELVAPMFFFLAYFIVTFGFRAISKLVAPGLAICSAFGMVVVLTVAWHVVIERLPVILKPAAFANPAAASSAAYWVGVRLWIYCPALLVGLGFLALGKRSLLSRLRVATVGLIVYAIVFWMIIDVSRHSIGVFGEVYPARLFVTLAILFLLVYSNGELSKLTIPVLDGTDLPEDKDPKSDAPARVASGNRFAQRADVYDADRDFYVKETPAEIGAGRGLRPLKEYTIPGAMPPFKAKPPIHLDILNAWSTELGFTPSDLDAPEPETIPDKPKLVVFSVSGGALRAGIWTTVVVEALRAAIPGFDRHVRLITGASGGMIGMAAYVAALANDAENKAGTAPNLKGLHGREILPDILNTPGLDEVARQLTLFDIPSIFDPRRQQSDRGRALDEHWVANFLPHRFRDIHDLEHLGKIPSIIFSPMLVEDGRRLLISNLDLDFLLKARGPILNDPQSRADYGWSLSQSALEFRTLFPDALPDFRLATAVRMNASFPYVSPAVYLPTKPPRRAVDAGYYDNYGVDIACVWIERHQEWLRRNTSGVLLVQMRDTMGQGALLGFPDDSDGAAASLSSAAAFLTAPVSAGLKARYATNAFRNDEQIRTLGYLLNDQSTLNEEVDTDPFFATAIFEFQNDGEVSLNWQLGPIEVQYLKNGMTQPANDGRLKRVKTWWNAKPAPRAASRLPRP